MGDYVFISSNYCIFTDKSTFMKGTSMNTDKKENTEFPENVTTTGNEETDFTFFSFWLLPMLRQNFFALCSWARFTA